MSNLDIFRNIDGKPNILMCVWWELVGNWPLWTYAMGYGILAGLVLILNSTNCWWERDPISPCRPDWTIWSRERCWLDQNLVVSQRKSLLSSPPNSDLSKGVRTDCCTICWLITNQLRRAKVDQFLADVRKLGWSCPRSASVWSYKRSYSV